MKKQVFFWTALLVLLLVSILAIPAMAGPPDNAAGTWSYQPFIDRVVVSDGNTFLKIHDFGVWTGTIEGASFDTGKVVIHASGAWTYDGTVHFEGQVDERNGSLTMYASGSRPDSLSDWTGRWVILDGTGELSRVRGQGTWWGPGSPGPGEWGDVYYSGRLDFAE